RTGSSIVADALAAADRPCPIGGKPDISEVRWTEALPNLDLDRRNSAAGACRRVATRQFSRAANVLPQPIVGIPVALYRPGVPCECHILFTTGLKGLAERAPSQG